MIGKRLTSHLGRGFAEALKPSCDVAYGIERETRDSLSCRMVREPQGKEADSMICIGVSNVLDAFRGPEVIRCDGRLD